MKQPNRLAPVIYGTITITLLAIVPFISLIQFVCCANAILGGVIAVNVYNKELTNLGMGLQYKDGVIMSVLSGILSSILVTGINIIIMLLSSENPITQMSVMLEQMNQPVTPQINDILQHFSNEFAKYGFSPTISIIMLISTMILYSGFASLGAVLTISIINKKKNNSSNNNNIDSFPVN